MIPRCLLPSAIAAIEGAIAHRYGAEFFQDVWMHPYSLHVFGMVLGFSLVMRIQIAYQRFWEGATQCSQFASKWADAAMQIVCFDEASKDAFSDHALEFRLQILHYVSLMHAVALCDIRRRRARPSRRRRRAPPRASRAHRRPEPAPAARSRATCSRRTRTPTTWRRRY